MADNVEITAGSGTSIATDDVGGVQYQVVKLDIGGDGAAAPLSNSNPVPVSDAGGSLTVDGTVAVTGVATAANQSTAIGHLATLAGAVSGTEVQVDIVGGGLTETKAAAATLSSVADTATSTTLKVSNANRLALIIVNDSTVDLYVKYGATASASSFTYKLGPGETLREELYTGIVDGIWASDASGSARVTELTAS